VGKTPHRKAGNIVKEKMAEWAKANWGNLSEKSAKSVINRVIAVIEKNPTTLKSALVGLTQSLNALGSKEDTSEQDCAEVWFVSEFITAMLLPIADHIDAITKENANTKASTSPKKRSEVWADSQEEALAIAEAQKPAKPARKPRGAEAEAPALEVGSDLLKALAVLKSAGLIK
jgi:hypothetical protein